MLLGFSTGTEVRFDLFHFPSGRLVTISGRPSMNCMVSEGVSLVVPSMTLIGDHLFCPLESIVQLILSPSLH